MAQSKQQIFQCTSIGGAALLLWCLACNSPKTQPLDLGVVTLQTDAGWKAVTPNSTIRKAQFTLPHVANDTEDAELVVYFFGAGQGGSVEANLERWYSQFAQPDSSSSAEKAKVEREVVDEMNLTRVDISGTYVAPAMPGSEAHHDEPNFRMLAAVLETSQGAYFFKLVGPEQTVAHWATSFSQFMKSAKRARTK